eukprot:9482164-Pyramimonas_sp.AAC.1
MARQRLTRGSPEAHRRLTGGSPMAHRWGHPGSPITWHMYRVKSPCSPMAHRWLTDGAHRWLTGGSPMAHQLVWGVFLGKLGFLVLFWAWHLAQRRRNLR